MQLSIDDIIRRECVPVRDCMLTVTDVNGEAGFLYFKDGELIEANYVTLWSKEALGHILAWELSEHTVAPLPLGIKRSLWDNLDSLLQMVPTGDGSRGSSESGRSLKPASPFDRYKVIPELYRVILIEGNTTTVAFDTATEPDDVNESLDWLRDYCSRVKTVGDSLGFGAPNRLKLDTDKYQILAIKTGEGYTALLRRSEASSEDLEADYQSLVHDPGY